MGFDGPVELSEVPDERAPGEDGRHDARQREWKRTYAFCQRAPRREFLVVELEASAGRHVTMLSDEPGEVSVFEDVADALRQPGGPCG
jgi:hypothetical protein